jgi:hypothetical protein
MISKVIRKDHAVSLGSLGTLTLGEARYHVRSSTTMGSPYEVTTCDPFSQQPQLSSQAKLNTQGSLMTERIVLDIHPYQDFK